MVFKEQLKSSALWQAAWRGWRWLLITSCSEWESSTAESRGQEEQHLHSACWPLEILLFQSCVFIPLMQVKWRNKSLRRIVIFRLLAPARELKYRQTIVFQNTQILRINCKVLVSQEWFIKQLYWRFYSLLLLWSIRCQLGVLLL